MESFARWTRSDGLHIDPWIRTHQRLGASTGRTSSLTHPPPESTKTGAVPHAVAGPADLHAHARVHGRLCADGSYPRMAQEPCCSISTTAPRAHLRQGCGTRGAATQPLVGGVAGHRVDQAGVRTAVAFQLSRGRSCPGTDRLRWHRRDRAQRPPAVTFSMPHSPWRAQRIVAAFAVPLAMAGALSGPSPAQPPPLSPARVGPARRHLAPIGCEC
jgi:hypothetical protein